MRKTSKISLTLGLALGIVILGMLMVNTFAYPLSIQVSRSLDKVALDESDLPQGNYYVIANRREPSNVPAENIALGWTEGYQIVFSLTYNLE